MLSINFYFDFLRFDIPTNTWSNLNIDASNWPTRYDSGFSLCAYRDKVYKIGGYLRIVSFDPGTDSWHPVDDTNIRAYQRTYPFVYDNKLHAIAKFVKYSYANIERYDANEQKFSLVCSRKYLK